MTRHLGDDGDNTMVAGDKGDELIGKGGNDLLIGGDGGDYLVGGSGHDTLLGGEGGDFLSAAGKQSQSSDKEAGDSLDGGGGNDYLWSAGGDTGLGGDGDDNVEAGGGAGGLYDGGAGYDSITFQFATNTPYIGDLGFLNSSGDGTIDGATVSNFEQGNVVFGAGDDIVDAARHPGNWGFDGGLGDDHLIGKGHADFLGGGDGSDTVEGGGGDDRLSASGTGADLLLGQGGDDRLSIYGYYSGITTLVSGAGDDTLYGGTHMEGGAGTDTLAARQYEFGQVATLSGGAGMDIYKFNWTTSSQPTAPDLIKDGTIGAVDFSAIDANTEVKGNDAFTVVQALDGHAGEMTITYSATENLTRVSGDVNGDGTADIVVLIKGDYSDPAGFVL